MLNINELKAILWMHTHGLALHPFPELVPDRLELHPKLHNQLLREAEPIDFTPGYDCILTLRVVEIYPEFHPTEWRIISTADLELYHGIDPQGLIIRPVVLAAIPHRATRSWHTE